MRETTASDIERINVIILIIGSIASLVIMRDYKYLLSFGAASAIMTINFRFLRRIMEGFFAQSSVSKKELMVKLPLKFLGLVALVAVVVVWGDINIVFFLIGLSTIFLSLLISQIVTAFSPEVRRKQDGA
jgi:hypothetical protein